MYDTAADSSANPTTTGANYADIRVRAARDKHAESNTPTISSHIRVAAAVCVLHSDAAKCSADRVDPAPTKATTATN